MSNSNDLIFIHIPKTGGTTINTAMQETYWMTEPDFNYRHILSSNRKSNAGDIFEPENFEKYKAYKIFMMLRHPVDRVASEYYFLRERQEFMELLKRKPIDFKSFIENRQTNDYVVNFLKGRRIYDLTRPKDSDLEDVLDAIDQIPIHVGIFEHFSDSLHYFSDATGIKWKKDIEAKRVTFKRPKVNEISDDLKELIVKNNQLDTELYEYCLEKFKGIQSGLNSSKISFTKDRYNHVVPYAAKTCLFEFCLENKKFIRAHFQFFKSLTFYLLNERKVRDGRVYVKSWNSTFIKSINIKYPSSNFSELMNRIPSNEDDPLETTIAIGESIDAFFKEQQGKANVYLNELDFNPANVPDIQQPKKGFFSKLFGK